MFFYHFLIPAQFGSVIASDALVPVRGFVFVERISGEVQYTEIQGLVGQDVLVGFRGRQIRFHFRTFCHELSVVQVPFVDAPHISQAEQGEQTHQPVACQFAGLESPKQAHTDQDDEETSPCVRSKDGDAHVFQIHQNRNQLFRWNGILQRPHFHAGYVAGEEEPRSKGKEQREAAGESQTQIESLGPFLQHRRTVYNLFQRHDGQQRNSEFGNDQDGRDCTEFIVHRYIIDEEIGHSHEVLSP